MPDIFHADTNKVIKKVAEKMDFSDMQTATPSVKKTVHDRVLNRTDPQLQKIDGFLKGVSKFTEQSKVTTPSKELNRLVLIFTYLF